MFSFTVISLAVNLAEIINEAGLSLEELIQELDFEIKYAGAFTFYKDTSV